MFNWPNPRVHTGFVPDLTQTVPVKRYGPGYQNIAPGVGTGHVGQSPELAPARLNGPDLSAGARAVLARAGHDGSEITYQEWVDLHMLLDGGRGVTYAKSIYLAERAAHPVPAPPDYTVIIAPPVVAPDDPEHTHSALLPPGFKQAAVWTLEVCGTRCARAFQAAQAAGVLFQEEAEEGIRRRLALIVALGEQVNALTDGEPVAENPDGLGQLECDAIWDFVNEMRRLIAHRQMYGYAVHPYWAQQDKADFFHSDINEDFKATLTAMSRVALLLKLRGKKLSYLLFGQPYETRDSEYVVGFYSWESQDPIMREFSGASDAGGGIWADGQQSE